LTMWNHIRLRFTQQNQLF